jgi:hypothetical protein
MGTFLLVVALPPSMEGSTAAYPSQNVRRGSTASVDGFAKQQATPVDDIIVSIVSDIPSLEY